MTSDDVGPQGETFLAGEVFAQLGLATGWIASSQRHQGSLGFTLFWLRRLRPEFRRIQKKSYCCGIQVNNLTYATMVLANITLFGWLMLIGCFFKSTSSATIQSPW